MRQGDRAIFKTLFACLLVLSAALIARAASDGYEIKERKTTVVGGWVGPGADVYDAAHLDPATKALIVQPVGGGATPADVNLKQVGGTTTLTGGIAGSQGVGGLAADAANLTAENPLLAAGSDGAKKRVIATTNKGEVAVVMTSTRASAQVAETPSHSGRILSNGATPVVLIAASASKTVSASGCIYNSNNLAGHTMQIKSSGGTVIREVPLGPGAPFFFTVGPGGDLIVSLNGEGLSFDFTDANGVAADLVATVSYVQQ